MPTHDLQELVDHLAARLQRSVTVTDPDIRILATSAHYGDEDEARVRAVLARVALPEVYRHIHSFEVRSWSEPGTVSAAPELGFEQRFVIPIRQGRTLLALLMVIDRTESGLTDVELNAAMQTTRAIVGILDRDQAGQQQRRAQRSKLLSDLLSDHDAAREQARSQAAHIMGGPVEQAVVMTMKIGSASLYGTEVDLEVDAGLANAELREGSRLAHVYEGGVATICSVTEQPPGKDRILEQGRHILDSVSSLLDESSCCTMGLCDTPTQLSMMRTAQKNSRLAAEAATLLPQFRPLATYSDLGVFSVLLRLQREDLGEVVPSNLRRLLENDSHGVLGETLTLYLASGGSIPVTAQRLRLHRTSLYYRLNQIETQLEMSLHDGEVRQLLHLGLKAMELLDAYTRLQDN
ncbi:PucR family transcriptional regulator [Rhodococcus spongiicola]|uniref:PucR family transcriptional regulator n=1 Tax=Rhodococcus spongiicola TaxID=2487352 RepID=UPI000FDECA0B|nr:helix-turn-helix domain-containing protein [Rhodococcus spongiicola]